MPSARRDMRDALKNRMVIAERPQIVEVPGERSMPGAKMIAIGRIAPNQAQPRKHFDQAGLEELAASVRERGIMQPLVVRPSGDRYAITMGERRFRAALLAGLDEVPVIVRDVSDEQAFLDALIENLQRANLTDEEEAEAYRGLLAQGHGVREIAAKLGITPSKVSRLTRVFEDPTLAAAIAEGKITKSQAQEMLAAPPKEKPRIIALIAERRKSGRPMGLGELRAAVTDARPSVALRNSSRTMRSEESGVALRNTSSPDVAIQVAEGAGVALRNSSLPAVVTSEESGVALRNTFLPDGVISVDDQRMTGGADDPASTAEIVVDSLSTARQRAWMLRKLFEQQLPLLYASRHDPEVAGDLAKIHERLSHILQTPVC